MVSQCDNRKSVFTRTRTKLWHTQARKNALRAALVGIVTVENNLHLHRLECDPDALQNKP